MNGQVTRREFLEAVVVGVPLPLYAASQQMRVHARSVLEQAIRQYERAWESDAGWDVAIAIFTNVIKTEPSFQLAYIYRAKAHYWSGAYMQAAADFSQAIQIDPLNEGGLEAWSSSYEAIRVFERKLGDRIAATLHWLRMALWKAESVEG
jgi:tetratricopeptide (TPR) repeat protein